MVVDKFGQSLDDLWLKVDRTSGVMPVESQFDTTPVKVSCAKATADGTYPTVFNNDGPDGSFGVTSPIFLDNITTDGKLLGTLTIPGA